METIGDSESETKLLSEYNSTEFGVSLRRRTSK
jgi:hypothetical protein